MAFGDKRVRYGEPAVLSNETFTVRAVSAADADPMEGGPGHVLLRDDETGEEWRLTAAKANELANALKACAKATA